MKIKYSTGLILSILMVLHAVSVYSQESDSIIVHKTYNFPNIPGYQTLVCDFHQHTIFSDGKVWPDIRVKDALSEGLDAMAITDHLEYQPHSDYVPNKDRNASDELARKAAKKSDLIVVNGAEITRDMPPGHANAIFLKDANKLLKKDDKEVFEEARRQDAFVIWNHPHWFKQNRDGVGELKPMHKELIKQGLIQGIEVVNNMSFSEEALKIALDNNLAIMSGSDIHGLLEDYNTPDGGRRPVTLVFAKEKSSDALKEALFAGRTVVWFDQTLIGKEENLVPLIEQSLVASSASPLRTYLNIKTHIFELTLENRSCSDLILENMKDYLMYNHADVITLKANSKKVIQVKLLDDFHPFEMHFKVLNALTAPGIHPVVKVKVSSEK